MVFEIELKDPEVESNATPKRAIGLNVASATSYCDVREHDQDPQWI